MHVLALTILVSLCLAGIFIVAFVFESKRRRGTSASPEHDALLPFDEADFPVARTSLPAACEAQADNQN